MDPITHLVVTSVLVGRDKNAIIAGLAPDLAFYATYPIWWLFRGRRAHGPEGELTLPPNWIRKVHYASHSLAALVVLMLATHRRPDRNRIWLAWLLHLALDVPTHARDRMAPRLFWPWSDWAHDGHSWSDVLWEALQAKRRRPN